MNTLGKVKLFALCVLFVLFSFHLDMEPIFLISSAIGFFCTFLHCLMVVYVKRNVWVRFVIPFIPVFILSLEFYNAILNRKEEMLFGPWFGFMLSFLFLYSAILFPFSINSIVFNRPIDTLFVILSNFFCVLIIAFSHKNLNFSTYGAYDLFFIGCIFLLTITTLIFPKKSQWKVRKEPDANT